MALVGAVNAAASTPALRSDGPPVGGSPLIVGGEQWGEIADGPVGQGPWTTARWMRALTGQFAEALVRGELWTADGTGLAGHIPVTRISEECAVGPDHRSIRGSHRSIRWISRMERSGSIPRTLEFRLNDSQ